MAIRVCYPHQCHLRRPMQRPYYDEWDLFSALFNQLRIGNPFDFGIFQPSPLLFFKLNDKEQDGKKKASSSGESEKAFSYKLDVKGFTPDDVQVKVQGQKLIVEGVKEEEEKNDGIESLTRRQFHKSIVLPDNVNADKLTSQMNDNGILEVIAPRFAIEGPGDDVKTETSTSSNESSESSTDTGSKVALSEKKSDDVQSDVNESSDRFSERPSAEEEYSCKLNIPGFSSDDVQIKTDGQKVKIVAKKEEKQQVSGIASYVLREFHQSLLLPDNVNTEKMTSQMSDDGVLELTAPRLSLTAPVENVEADAENVEKSDFSETANGSSCVSGESSESATDSAPQECEEVDN